MTYTPLYKSVLAVFLALLATATAQAQVSLNGVATHSELGKELFIAGLYVSTPSADRNSIVRAQEEKQIQVRVTADKLSSRSFKRLWIEGMAVNAPPKVLKAQSGNVATFANMLKVRLIEGDIFTIARQADGVSVSVNGALLGEISDPRFFDVLLLTLLGPVPLSSESRDALSQAGKIDAALLARYEATAPSDQRIADVEAALGMESSVTLATAATERQNNPAIPAPTLSAPPITAPVKAAAPSVTKSTTAKTEVAIAAPKLDKVKPKEVEKPAPTPKPAPQKVATAPVSSVLEEDEDDDSAITAESIYQQQLYVGALRKHTYQHINYPKSALDKGREGNLRLNVVIDRKGKIISSGFIKESEYRAFNREAEKALKRAAPFPSVPKEVPGETFTFSLPIVFVLGN